MQTNRDVIQSLSTRKLAELFVFEQWRTEYDYDYDDNLIECGESSYYVSTLIDGQWADIFDAIDAVAANLDAEMDEDWEYELKAQAEANERAVS